MNHPTVTKLLYLLSILSLLPMPRAAAALATPEGTSANPAVEPRWPDGLRKWTPAISVEVRYYGSKPGLWPENAREPAATFAPDGRHFYVVSSHGDRGADSAVQTLEVYNTAQVEAWLKGSEQEPPKPRIRFERALFTRAPYCAINFMRWTSDSEAIVFVGYQLGGSGPEQVYRLRVPSGELEQLSHNRHRGVATFRIAGDSLLYGWSQLEDDAPPPAYPVLPIPRDAHGDISLISGRVAMGIMAGRVGEKAWSIPGDYFNEFKAAFSPDAHFAVVVAGERDSADDRKEPGSCFLLVDFSKRSAQVLSDARSVAGSQVTPQMAWSKDGTSVLLVGAMAPGGAGPCIASYEPVTGRWQVLETLPAGTVDSSTTIQSAELIPEAGVVIKGGASMPARLYSWREGRWSAEPLTKPMPAAAPSVPVELKVAVAQSQNEPPRLVVSAGGLEKTLSRPDPAVADVWRAPVERFATHTSDGMEVTGALSLPRESATRPLPLVIQIGYDFGEPDIFLPDGAVPSAFARQTMNARGLAVLSIDATGMQHSKKRSTPQEGPGMVDQIDAAVEVLAQRGLVDAARVGVVGFSRTGFQTFYAITHSRRTKIAAAEIFDATTFSYVQDLREAVCGVQERRSEDINGGTFWQNRRSWLEHDVLFNADRITAPALFVEAGATRRAGEDFQDHDMLNLAKIGALKLTRRPFEMLFMIEGHHGLTLPRQREASMAATADWMTFWLRSEEDPDPAKAEQYARWRTIRDKWALQQAWEAKGNPVGSEPR